MCELFLNKITFLKVRIPGFIIINKNLINILVAKAFLCNYKTNKYFYIKKHVVVVDVSHSKVLPLFNNESKSDPKGHR